VDVTGLDPLGDNGTTPLMDMRRAFALRKTSLSVLSVRDTGPSPARTRVSAELQSEKVRNDMFHIANQSYHMTVFGFFQTLSSGRGAH
jgi:hypothetical protein